MVAGRGEERFKFYIRNLGIGIRNQFKEVIKARPGAVEVSRNAR
jgi:hypothetical protein